MFIPPNMVVRGFDPSSCVKNRNWTNPVAKLPRGASLVLQVVGTLATARAESVGPGKGTRQKPTERGYLWVPYKDKG